MTGERLFSEVVGTTRDDGVWPALRTRRWPVVLGIEMLALALYFGVTSATVTTPRYVLYPFVWINAGLWAVWRTDHPPSAARHRGLAGVVAAGYLLSLLAITGLVGLTNGETVAGLQVRMASPGWGPIVSYLGPHVHATVIPYRVAGYLSLAYLVYTALLTTTRAALSGVVGLASCISCSFSILLSLIAVLTGGSAAVLGTVYGASIDISTAVFLLAIGLLVWLPDRQ